LAKAEPSWASVATFRAAAGDGEEPGSGEVVDVRRAVREGQPTQSDTPTTVNTLTMEAPVPCMTAMSQPRAIIELQAEAPSVISDDALMSIGDSEEEGSESDGSDGFSHSGSGICRGDSTVSRGSRKRPADESPERELGETSRREFSGLITHSEGGCRIYVPPTEKRDGTDATCVTGATAEVSPTPKTDEAPRNNMSNATCAADTMFATTPELAVYAMVATDTTCKMDVATSMIATQMSLSTTGTPLASTDIPTRDQSVLEIEATCSTTLGNPTIWRSSTPEPDTVVLYTVSEPDALSQIGQIQVTGTPVPIAEEVASQSNRNRSEVMVNATAGLRAPLATEGWGWDAQMVEGLFQIIITTSGRDV